MIQSVHCTLYYHRHLSFNICFSSRFVYYLTCVVIKTRLQTKKLSDKYYILSFQNDCIKKMSSVDPLNRISDNSPEINMAGPTDETTHKRVSPESGAVSELKKHSKESSVTNSESNAVKELEDTPSKSESINGSSDEPTAVVPQSVVNDDLNSFCEPIQLISSPKETRDFTDISQSEEHVPDIEKEKERLSPCQQEDDRLSDTFNPSLLGHTTAESFDGSHPDLTDALCDADDTVHRSSSESLDESMRPHSSLLSPHPFTTSTPRPRISSTPCSGAERPRVPYSGSTEGPFSNPAASSSSKSYDYLLKVSVKYT